MNESSINHRCVIIGADAAGLETAYEIKKLGLIPAVIDLSEEVEMNALSLKYGLRPYFKEPEMSERINEISGNIQQIKISTGGNRWTIPVTRNDIIGCREHRLRSVFREVVTTVNIPVKDDLDDIILTRKNGKYHLTTLKNGKNEEYSPELIIVTRRNFAVKNGLISQTANSFFISIESDFENVYGRPGNLEYFYSQDSLFPAGYILIEQISSRRAHLTLRFASDSKASGEIDGTNYIDWISENIGITASRLGTASQISDTIVGKKYIYNENTCFTGETFILVGDAAGISEPLFGNSYPYILYSGKIAAHIAQSAFESGDLSSDFLLKYDTMLRSTISPVMNSFQAVRDQIFSSSEKLNEFIEDINRSRNPANERFMESMIKYIYRKGFFGNR